MKNHRLTTASILASSIAALALTTTASAQSLYGVQPAGNYLEWAGPPNPASGYPNAWPLGSFTHPGAGCLPGPLPAAPALAGDIGFDRGADETWITDGQFFGAYDTFGNPLRSFDLPPGLIMPGTIKGLGVDPLGQLWITDGRFAAAVLAPAVNCVPPVVVVPPFPLPLPAGVFATDIDWDPRSVAAPALWICDTSGMVTQIVVGGGLGPVPAFFAPAVLAGCVAPTLTGLAVDTAAPNSGLYVTDGNTILYATYTGAPAAPTFYTTQNCYPAPIGGLQGLAFSAHALPYGPRTNVADTCPAPRLSAKGNSIQGGLVSLAVEGGAVGDDIPFMLLGGAALFPPVPVLGAQVLVAPGPPLFAMPAFAGGGCSGTSNLLIPIPGGVPTGLNLKWQSVMLNVPSLLAKSTNAVAFTTALP